LNSGIGKPRGGSAQLFSKLKKQIDKNGEIHLNEKAQKIIIENGIVTNIKTDKATYCAQNIIFAASLPLVLDLLGNLLLPKATLDYANNIENSSSLTIDFITDRPVTNIRSSTLGVDIPIWARFQSNTDDSFTPHGKYISTWGIMLPWYFDGDTKTVEQTEKRLKDTITTIFPDFLPMVIKERKTVVPVMNGNVLTTAQSKPHRPNIECPTIKGLYFIDDTVKGDGCSGDISFSSAMIAADKILGV
jgi:phytoene dehydrogenase-like protein